MITFPDPDVLQYSGIHEAISAAGHTLAQADGVWVASNEAAVQAIINAYSVDQTKVEVTALIDAHAKDLRDRVVSGISVAEMASWSTKQDEARKFSASGFLTDAPLLQAEAEARGVTVAELALRVLNNAQQLSMLEAAVAGVAGKHRDAVAAKASHAEIAAYDWHIGWPVV